MEVFLNEGEIITTRIYKYSTKINFNRVSIQIEFRNGVLEEVHINDRGELSAENLWLVNEAISQKLKEVQKYEELNKFTKV